MQDDTGTGTALAPAVTPVLGSDPHDFAGLYIRHRSSFTSHARRYLRDPRDADEVVQEAFLRLFLAMPELESELQALAYCRRTITNLCIDRYRADARRPRLVALEGAPLEELAEDDTGDPVVRAEDAALVRAALSQLPALHRAALVKREIEEKPLPVIADELDVAEDSVKHLLFRARRTLRKLLAGTSVAPGVDAELTRGLHPAVRGASSGVAGLLLLALLGLGSGPDLRSVPVVGVDLPDVLGVTAVADAVGGAVRDVVGALVPGSEAQASGAGRDAADRPLSSSQPLAPAAADQPAGPGGAAATPGRGPAAVPNVPAAASGSGRTTVVTVVDGVPVVTTLPAAGSPVPAAAGTGPQGSAPGTSTGRAPGSFLPTPVGPRLPTGGRDVAGPTTVTPVFPGAAAPTRPSAPDTSGRSDDAARTAERAADRAADAEEKAAEAADKGAEKAAKAAEKQAEKAADVAEKADKAAGQAVEKAQQKAVDKAAEQSAEKAAKAAEQSAEKAAKAAEQSAEKAAKAAERAAKEASKAAERSAEAPGVPAAGPASAVLPAPAP